MKKPFYILLLVLFALNLTAQHLYHDIIVEGEVKDEVGYATDCRVEVYHNNKKIDEEITEDGKYKLLLVKDRNYVLKFVETGFVTKKVEISTKNITDVEIKYGLFAINLPVDIFEDFPGLNTSALKNPIAKVYYNNETDDFAHDTVYYKKMKVKVDKIKAQLLALKNAAYKKAIKKADKQFKNVEYEDAWLSYLDALDVYPNRKYPQDQIEEIKRLLLQEESFADAYDRAIKDADNKFDKKQWNPALTGYKKSLLYKPNEIYPKSRIEDIETILNYLAQNPKKIEEEPETKITSKKESVYSNLSYQDSKKAIKIIDKKISKNPDSLLIAKAYYDKGMLQYEMGEFDDAVDNLKKSANIYDRMNDSKSHVAVINSIANLYDNIYDYGSAEDYYAKTINIYKGLNEQEKVADLYMNIADVNFNKGKFNKAINYYDKAREIYKAIGIMPKEATSLNSIGVSFFELENYESALSNFNKSIEISGKNNLTKEYAMTLNNVGNIKYEEDNLNNALDFYNKSVTYKNKIDFLKGVAVSFHNIGNVYRKLNKLDEALKFYKKSIEIAEQTGYKPILIKNYAALANLYADLEDCQKSLKYFKLYTGSKYLIDRYNVYRQVSETSYTYSNNKYDHDEQIAFLKKQIYKQKLLLRMQNREKTREIKLLNREKRLKELELNEQQARFKRQRIYIYVGVLVLLFFLVFLFLLLKQIKQKKKINKLLVENQEQITDSIVYANRIKTAILPPFPLIDKLFSKYFILNIPRDIVSGDFYWVKENNNKIIVAVGDCTGHGVPGGFLSMISIAFLNEISGKTGILSTSDILNELRQKIITNLHQDESDNTNRDGLDIAICIIDKTTKTIEFSGAYNPLVIVSKTQTNISENIEPSIENDTTKLFEVPADRMPISVFYNTDKVFTKHKIKYNSGDKIYMFSDGIIDQFGGTKTKRFMKKAFYNLLLDISDKNIMEQEKEIKTTYQNWKGENEQVDDILIMGIEL